MVGLISNIKNSLVVFFSSGHERSVKAKKNIVALLFIRGYSIAINLALIPITLEILNNYKFGVWITIFNVLSWIQIFDIGIGNGLRNKYTESIAKKNSKDAREYVSTAYIIMGIIALLLILLFSIPWYLIDWTKFFNTDITLYKELSYLIGIAFILTALQFLFKLINTILTADHKPALSALIMAASNTIIFSMFLMLKSALKENLIGVGAIYTTVPLFVLIVASFWLFSKKYKNIKPSIKFYNKEKINDLFSLGSRFFVIQIAVLVIFQTDALIISHTLSPEEVTPYNIVFRYFGIITMLVGIIMTPFWSAFTEAYTKKDFSWIRKTMKKQIIGFAFVVIIVILLLILAKPIINIWIPQKLNLSNLLLLGMALYAIISIWNNIFSYFLNGISRIKTQLYTSVVGLSINIPLSILLARSYGNGGVIIATCISLSPFALFGALEAFKIIKEEK